MIKNNFALFSIQNFVVGAHLNHHSEAILMTTHKIGFQEEYLTKIIFELSSTTHLICSSGQMYDNKYMTIYKLTSRMKSS